MTDQNSIHSSHYSSSILAWIAWVVAAIFYAYQFFHRIAPSVMASDLMLTFSINAESLGSLAALYFYAYAATQIPAGVFLDCFGARKTLSIAGVFIAVGSLLFANTTDFTTAKIARLLAGLGSTVAFTGCLMIASSSLPQRYFNTLVGVTSTIGIVGALISEMPLTHMIQSYGWRPCMSVAGLVGFAITLILYLTIRDPKLDPINKRHHVQKTFEGVFQLLKSPQAWLLALVAGTRVIPVISFGELWAVPYLQQGHAFSASDASMILSCVFLGIGIGGPVFGWLSNRLGTRQAMILGAWSSLICYLTLFLHTGNTPLVLAAMFFLIGLTSSSMLQCFSLICSIAPLHSRGAAIGFINTAVMIAGALFQPLIGKLLDMSWDGTHIGGIPNYTLKDFHFALSIVIPCMVISLLLSYMIKEPEIESIQNSFDLK